MAEIAWTDFQSSKQLGGLSTSLNCICYTITANIVEEPGNFFPGSFHYDGLLDERPGCSSRQRYPHSQGKGVRVFIRAHICEGFLVKTLHSFVIVNER